MYSWVPNRRGEGGQIIGWQWNFRENPPKKHKKGLKTAQKSQKSSYVSPAPVYLAPQSRFDHTFTTPPQYRGRLDF